MEYFVNLYSFFSPFSSIFFVHFFFFRPFSMRFLFSLDRLLRRQNLFHKTERLFFGHYRIYSLEKFLFLVFLKKFKKNAWSVRFNYNFFQVIPEFSRYSGRRLQVSRSVPRLLRWRLSTVSFAIWGGICEWTFVWPRQSCGKNYLWFFLFVN